MRKAPRAQPEAPADEFVITSAPESHAAGLARRRRNYVVSMLIRIVCIVLIFALPKGWWTILIALGAVFIPYFAVVGANAGAEMFRQEDLVAAREPALPSHPSEASAEPAPAEDPSDEDQIIVVEPERA